MPPIKIDSNNDGTYGIFLLGYEKLLKKGYLGMIDKIDPEVIIPVHTENLEWFRE